MEQIGQVVLDTDAGGTGSLGKSVTRVVVVGFDVITAWLTFAMLIWKGFVLVFLGIRSSSGST